GPARRHQAAGGPPPPPHTAGNRPCPRGTLPSAQSLADDGQVPDVARPGAVPQHLKSKALIKTDQERQRRPHLTPQLHHSVLPGPLLHPPHEHSPDSL